MKNRQALRVKASLARFFPPYAWLPAILIPAYNVLVFFGTRPINRLYPAHSLSTSLDELIPFLPWFVLFYILAYLQWVLCYFVTLRHSRALACETLSVNLIAKTVCLICFLAFPTATVRPEVAGSGVWNTLVRWIYVLDEPDNLFPSIHCLESWISMRSLWRAEEIPIPVQIANGVLTLFVCASTLFVKQHVLPDVFGGILAVELGYLLTRLTRSDRLLRRLEPRFSRGIADLY